nr:hypothetical protein [Tanacetum cinerariifolium]
SNLEEDLKEDLEDDQADYPADGGDADDEPSNDDDDASKEDEDEEEEHLASADFIAAASQVADPVPFAEETEPFETVESVVIPPPLTAYRTTTRMSIRAQTPIPFPSEAEVDRLLAIPTPPSSPLTPLSSPLPRIPSPPFPIPSPHPTNPTYTKAPLGYEALEIRLRTASPPPLPLSSPLPLPPRIILPCTMASMVMMRAATSSTYCLAPLSGTPRLLPIPLPTPSPPLLLPSTDCRAKVLEVVLPPQKRLCIAPGPRYDIRKNSSAPPTRSTGVFRADYGFVGTLDAEIRHDLDREIGYGFTDVWEDPYEIAKEIPATNVAELDQRMTNFVTTVRDRRFHARTSRLIDGEARVAREAWAHAMDASDTRPQTTGTARKGTDFTEDIANTDGSTTKSAETY